LKLALAAMFIGRWSAWVARHHRRNPPQFVVRLSSTFVALPVSIPTFWLGISMYHVFGLWLEWLPISGRVNPRLGADPSAHFWFLNSLLHGDWVIFKDALRHLVLPALTLAGGGRDHRQDDSRGAD